MDTIEGGRARTGRRRLRGRGDRGAALVEFAIISPVLFMVLLGMITGGLALSKKIDMTDAAREGARFGATVPIEDPDNATQVAAWSTKVKTRITELSGGALKADDLCVTLVKSTGTTAAADSNCNVADPANSKDDYIVRVRATQTAKLEALVWSRNLNLVATVAARYERGEG